MFTRPNGSIIVHVQRDPLTDIAHFDYTWEGGDVVTVAWAVFRHTCESYPKPGERFHVGPFVLRCLAEQFEADAVIACREHPITAPLRYAWYRAGQTIGRVYRRIILTFAVWGLAWYDPSRFPSWQDVYMLMWLVPHVTRMQQWFFVRRMRRIARRVNVPFRGEF